MSNKLDEIQEVALVETNVLLESLRDQLAPCRALINDVLKGKKTWAQYLRSEDMGKLVSVCEDLSMAVEGAAELNNDGDL